MRLPGSAIALVAFGVILVAGAWLYTVERVRSQLAEAVAIEFSKNNNLALALDFNTKQLLNSIDQFVVLIKRQYEGPPPGIPLNRLIPQAMWSPPFTFIGVTDERGDVVESLQPFAATNASDREMFKVHQQRDTKALLIAAPLLGRISGQWAITLSRRINKPDGSFGGIVAISIEPRYLTELFENTTLGRDDVMSLVMVNGITLARRRGTSLEFGTDISQSQLMTEAARNPIGNYIGPGAVDRTVRAFSYRRMKDYPLLATVGTATTDAFALVEQRAQAHYQTAVLASLFITVACVMGAVLLTRQERTRAKLREQASLLDKAQDAIMVGDLDGRLTYWNKGAERLYGWTADEALGRTVTDLFAANQDFPQFRKAFAEVQSTGEWTGDLLPLNKSGQRVITESRWTLVRDPAGRPRSILTINTDVTERRQLEQQFLRAQRMESIGTLAGGIAHDLNNVLTPIMLSLELMKEDNPTPATREILDTIGASARRGAEMVRQVLSFARGVEGRRVEIDAGALVAEVERMARDTLPKNIDIRTRVEPGLPLLLGDPTQLHQVLLNLCVNARDSMPEGGQMSISAEPAVGAGLAIQSGLPSPLPMAVILQVEDTGTGISPEILHKIFDPVFTTKDPGKGTGLGLSTSQSIVKSHGGHLLVDSVVGRGTRFRVFLPASTGVETPIAAAEIPAPSPSERQTVLVVDDEAAIRRIAQRTLQAAGYRVLLAANGAEAVEVFRAHHADVTVVLMDMTMPILDGAPAIQALARIDPSVSIVAASGIPANERAAFEAGPQVKEFLPKPFTGAALLKVLRRATATPVAAETPAVAERDSTSSA
ncbi:MAG: ATP-binding protein [Vicinamibacterales bacterium]